MASQVERGATFCDLHRGKPFIMPNPWDAGSARLLAGLGFPALATTSSAFAFTRGRADGEVSLEELTEHVALVVAATDLPVSVDLENGFGPDPADAAQAIRQAADAGGVGGSIEDYDPDGFLYELPHAVDRIAAAVEVARGLDFPFMVTARAENHIRGNPDLFDTMQRLQAYEDAGADVLYAPGLSDSIDIATVCASVSKPVNVLAVATLTADQIFGAGAQRISVGGSLAWVAASATAQAGSAIRDGDFSVLNASSPW